MTTIVVATCHKYRDAWLPFADLFRLFWPDCTYDRVFVTDEPAIMPEWRIIASRRSGGWCMTLQDGLARISSDYVLLLQEDFWFTAAPNVAGIKIAEQWLNMNSDFGCVRLAPIPGPDGEDLTDDLGLIMRSADYYCSCQASLWRCEYLLQILDMCAATASAASASDFETQGSAIVRKQGMKHASWKRGLVPYPVSYLCSAISRGKWSPSALAFAKNMGVTVDTSLREIEST